MSAKKCIRCNEEKPLGDFYAHRAMADGHLGKCKDCCKKEANERRREKLEQIRAYDRARNSLPHRVERRKQYANTPEGRAAHARANLEYRMRHPERRKAHQALRNAVRAGIVVKMPCLICGDEKVEAHHTHYSDPLAVVWLCVKHHKQTHKEAEDGRRDALRAWRGRCA